jgi:hypothetical protein
MPARLIHRFGNSDRPFRGFAAATLADVRIGHAVFFGLADHRPQAQAVRDASWFAPQPARASVGWDLGDAEGDCGTVCAAIRQRSGRPILVGGTIAHAAELVRTARAKTVVQFSPRLDLPTDLLDGRRLIAIGCHDLLPRSSVRRWREAGGIIVTATGDDPLTERLSRALEHASQAPSVLILDASVVDTGFAAGASGLNVGGLSPLEYLDAVQAALARFPIEGLAIINLAPERDPRGHSELLFAETVDAAVGRFAAGASP